MAWYDRILGRDVQDQEKLNPAQSFIGMDEGMTIDTREIKDNYRSAYEELVLTYYLIKNRIRFKMLILLREIL